MSAATADMAEPKPLVWRRVAAGWYETACHRFTVRRHSAERQGHWWLISIHRHTGTTTVSVGTTLREAKAYAQRVADKWER